MITSNEIIHKVDQALIEMAKGLYYIVDWSKKAVKSHDEEMDITIHSDFVRFLWCHDDSLASLLYYPDQKRVIISIMDGDGYEDVTPFVPNLNSWSSNLKAFRFLFSNKVSICRCNCTEKSAYELYIERIKRN